MSKEYEKYKTRVLQACTEKNMFLQVEDGYYQFFPESIGSYYTSDSLRIIADELDKRNVTWDKEVKEALAGKQE